MTDLELIFVDFENYAKLLGFIYSLLIVFSGSLYSFEDENNENSAIKRNLTGILINVVAIFLVILGATFLTSLVDNEIFKAVIWLAKLVLVFYLATNLGLAVWYGLRFVMLRLRVNR